MDIRVACALWTETGKYLALSFSNFVCKLFTYLNAVRPLMTLYRGSSTNSGQAV